jgi:putative transposase
MKVGDFEVTEGRGF